MSKLCKLPIDHIDFERIIADCRLSLWQKFLVYLGLKVKAYDIPSTSNPGQLIQFYYAHCKEHGYFVGYEHGFNKELRCPICIDELMRENVRMQLEKEKREANQRLREVK